MRTFLLTVFTALLVLLGASVVPTAAQEAIRTGEITKISADTHSFTIKTARGETNIVTTDATVVKDGDKTLKLADLKVGDNVRVTGVRKGADVEAKEVAKTAPTS
jgi:hypothetical protein